MSIDLYPPMACGVPRVLEAIGRGIRRIVLTAATGGGKTRGALALAEHYLAANRPVILYTNRKLVLEQTSGVVASHGMAYGVRAAGHFPEPHQLFQLSSIQTEHARVTKAKVWDLHPADLVLVDEGHLYTSDGVAAKIIKRHLEAGAAVVYLTATPIGMGHMADELVIAGRNSELRDCGALVRVRHYGPDEPDLKAIGQLKINKLDAGKDLSATELAKAFPKTKVLFGRVHDWYRRLNPDGRPTILFASGVSESLWFAEQFCKAGIPSAHIDGEEVWINGTFYASDRAAREGALDASRDGSIRVLCNRYVLREGIDAPWLSHGIFATVFGSFQSYLQSGGRLLRSHPSLRDVTLQDHGGNWHRHGSLNADQEWTLDTNVLAPALRIERMRTKEIREPYRCPRCGMILTSPRCPCGHVVDLRRKSRPVITIDGQLVEHRGEIYKPRTTQLLPNTLELWKSIYFGGGMKKNWTFRKARGWFYQKYRYFPPETLPLMPVQAADWFKRIPDVPPERLNYGGRY